MKVSDLCIMVSFDIKITIKNNCIMHEDNYYYKLLAV